eukprot:4735333-Pyramimonas_sp.AAC.1
MSNRIRRLVVVCAWQPQLDARSGEADEGGVARGSHARGLRRTNGSQRGAAREENAPAAAHDAPGGRAEGESVKQHRVKRVNSLIVRNMAARAKTTPTR